MLSLWPRLRQPAAACLLAATLAVGACSHPQAARLEPVFCYQTLAYIDCYAAPDRYHGRELVGVYLRDPGDPGWPDAWLRPAGG